MSSGNKGGKERRLAIAKATRACGRCKPHDGENRNRRPKPDQYKTRRPPGGR
jgi:hypothetical protein